jgi:hypothetical protein
MNNNKNNNNTIIFIFIRVIQWLILLTGTSFKKAITKFYIIFAVHFLTTHKLHTNEMHYFSLFIF